MTISKKTPHGWHAFEFNLDQLTQEGKAAIREGGVIVIYIRPYGEEYMAAGPSIKPPPKENRA